MLSILPESLHAPLRRVWNALLPQSCILCGADSSDTPLCAPCIADLPRLPAGSCPQCAEPTCHGELCGRCLVSPPHFDAAFSPYRYDFPLDRLIQALKYGGLLALAGWFGRQLATTPAGAAGARDFDFAIPLPLHPARLQLRGFNQSAEIARAACREIGLALDIASCRRVRPTPPQAELPLAQRAANVRGAFECRTDLSGRRILLIDDVMTSGATLDECARTLKLHGAAKVTVAVVARALRK